MKIDSQTKVVKKLLKILSQLKLKKKGYSWTFFNKKDDGDAVFFKRYYCKVTM